MGRLHDRVAIVTGGGQGVGRGIALAFAKEGARVVVVGRTESKLIDTAQRVADAGGVALPLVCDVSRRSDCRQIVAETVDKFGDVNVLVNCAGTNRPRRFEEITDEDLESILGSSLFGTIFLMQACFPYMRPHGGKVINVGSGGATQGGSSLGAYAAAKEAIRGISKVAAREWGRYGINVNVICPMAWTPLVESVRTLRGDPLNKDDPEELRAVPIGRWGDPEQDIGRVCVFLASADSDFVTGRTIHVDGGTCAYDM